MRGNPLRRYFRHGFLPQLIAFEACVRLGSVTRAAEELALAQPTVSCLLRKLSDAVGAPVTRVRDRRVQPTAAGVRLLALFEEIGEAFARYEAWAAAPGPRYDAAETVIESRWLSSSRPRRSSPWKRRALPCPLAKPKRNGTTGVS